jgi:diguanylate cyclase (GGDEF)-like protein/PAS domain S-box-containing protein
MTPKKIRLELSPEEISEVLLDNISSGVLLFVYCEESHAYRAIYANRSAEIMEKMSQQEIVGMDLLELYPYDAGELLQHSFDEVRVSGTSRRLPRTLVRGVYAEGWRECFLAKTREGKILMIYLDMSQVQRSEESMQSMVRHLNYLLEFMPDPIMSVDSEGRVETWNRAMEQLTGTAKRLAIGKQRLELLRQERGEGARALHEVLLSGDRSVLQQDHIRSHSFLEDGTLLVELYDPNLRQGEGGYLSVRLGALYNEDGSVMGVIQSARDVTGQVLANQQLQEERERLAVTLNSIGDGIIVVDVENRVTMLNPVAEELTGWTLDDARGKDIHAIFHVVHETTRAIVDNPMDQVLAKGIIVGLANHSVLIDKEGRGRSIADSAAPIRDADGRTVGGILVFRDVTEQREQELRIEASERRFRQIYETMEQGMAIHEIVLDAEGQPVDYVFTSVNPSFERLTGLSAQDLIGRTVLEVLPKTEDYWIREYGEVALTGKSKVFEQYSQELGRTFEVTAYSPAPLSFAVLVTDVTERRRAAEQLRFLSLHDRLTGLHNRHFFEQEMQRLDKSRATRVGMLFCDVDGLKLVNDTFGHSFGDAQLIAVAEVLQATCGRDHLLARVGGDEFAVLALDTTLAELQELANSIREGARKVGSVAGTHLPLGVSVGFAASKDEHIPSLEIYKAADDNMYREKLYRSGSVRSAAVQALMMALEARDFVTEGHALRLIELIEAFAGILDLTGAEVIDLRLLAQFHDIGKVGVPDRILFKPGPLDAAETTEMRRHAEMGHRIAQSVPDLLPIADLILKHHEWWDGSGYPLGLTGEEIPLACRLLAIADAYDAMTSNRPYREAMPHDAAVQELQRCAGVQFDPQLVQLFAPVLDAFAGKMS